MVSCHRFTVEQRRAFESFTTASFSCEIFGIRNTLHTNAYKLAKLIVFYNKKSTYESAFAKLLCAFVCVSPALNTRWESQFVWFSRILFASALCSKFRFGKGHGSSGDPFSYVGQTKKSFLGFRDTQNKGIAPRGELCTFEAVVSDWRRRKA